MLDPNALVSIVIPNYNYEAFVAAAIESALALDWPQVEVIVVDDGSSDGSRHVIARYADRVQLIEQANAGQLAACNAGFERSRGEVVFFLDSDDMLHPGVVRELAPLWHEGVSKVQFQMRSVDAGGHSLGTVFPQFSVVPGPQEVRRWSLATGNYPTPPGSGNAYSRRFLEKIFPQQDELLGKIADSGPITAAPFFGDVMTVDKPLVAYRVHGRNDGAVSELDGSKFARDVARTLQRFAYGQRIAASVGLEMPDGALNRSLHYLPYRLASLRLAPSLHPVAGDHVLKVLWDAMRAALTPQGVAPRGRLTLLAWFTLAALSPPALSRRFILWRFAPQTRPQFLLTTLRQLRVIR